jgi:hypothetical protein
MFRTVVRRAALVSPWLAVLIVSASIAYGMTAAVTGGELVGPAHRVPTVSDIPADDEACDVTHGWRLYVGLSSWIPAPSSVCVLRAGDVGLHGVRADDN